jgi:hypothetical protein
MSQVTLQGNASGTGIFTIAAPNSNTNRTVNLPDAGGDVVLADATQTLTNKSISGAQINSGTVATARLGSGTADSTTFLRGDGSWQTITVSPSTAAVLNAYAGAQFDGVGTYAVAYYAITANGTQPYAQTRVQVVQRGATIAGSNLRVNSRSSGSVTLTPTFEAGSQGFDAVRADNTTAFPTGNTVALSGTWRAMYGGGIQTSNDGSSRYWFPILWLRIS